MGSATSAHIKTLEDQQARANAALWSRKNLVRRYATARLRPVETVVLSRYRESLSGRVLELGCGAGRVTGHLCDVASSVHGIDTSPAMVAYCRHAYRRATFSEGDIRDLGAYEDDPFGAVVAPFNVLDVLSHADRRRTLDGVRRVLAPGGLLIMSSHNRGFAPRVRGPASEVVASVRSGNPRKVAGSVLRLPRRLRNRRPLRRYEHIEPGYAILNDTSHDYAALHYYISRDGQVRQLAEHGFELLECLDLAGETVEEGGAADDCPELHYVARRRD